MEEALDSQGRHLRAVPEVSSTEAPGSRPGDSQSSGSAGSAPALVVGATAAAFRREADLLRSVRGPASGADWQAAAGRTPLPPASGVAGSARPPAPQPSAPTARSEDQVTIGERFDAIASAPGSGLPGDAPIPARIDAALDRLRLPATDPGTGLLPLGSLRRMAEAGDPRAGEWLLALLATLHRRHPGLRVDVRCDGRTTAVTSSEAATVIESRQRRRPRSERDLHLRLRTDRLALGASGARLRGSGGRRGRLLFGELLNSPLSLLEMVDDGVVVGPRPAWAIVAHALKAVPEGFDGSFVHSDGEGGEVTVTMRPGRPLEVAAGASGSAQAIVVIPARSTLEWFAGRAANESVEGDRDVAMQAARLAAIAFSPIRPRN